MKNNHKHLTLSNRIVIEQGLNAGQTFAAIATSISKDPTTISKEVRKHRTIKHHTLKARRPNCIHLKDCRIQHLCKDIVCHKYCRDCSKCYSLCSHYEIHECKRINRVPYVCNACKSLNCCPKNRWIYVAKFADDAYHELLSFRNSSLSSLQIMGWSFRIRKDLSVIVTVKSGQRFTTAIRTAPGRKA